jgi:tRNA pseudouridine38-40 synthase
VSRYFARVEYDGGTFSGWQKQPGVSTVQGEIERAFSTIFRQDISITGAGRTDAGVHGRGQAFHVDLPPVSDGGKIVYSLNALVGPSIAIYDFKKTSDAFHARFSARERTYCYYMATRKMPLYHGSSLYVPSSVDWGYFQRQLNVLTGRHEFTSFCSSGCYTDNHFCTIRDAFVEERGRNLKVVTIRADRFLYKMVRTIIGTALDGARGTVGLEFDRLLQKKDRNAAGTTAPAQGLVLEYVRYDEV